MKKHFKLLTLVSTVTILFFVVPYFAFAQTSTSTSSLKQKNFCSKIEKISEKVSQEINTREVTYKEKLIERKMKIDERSASRDDIRLSNRTDWDAHRTELFTELLAQA